MFIENYRLPTHFKLVISGVIVNFIGSRSNAKDIKSIAHADMINKS
jgi:hypothetical protein